MESHALFLFFFRCSNNIPLLEQLARDRLVTQPDAAGQMSCEAQRSNLVQHLLC
jgi:hypothetical protein